MSRAALFDASAWPLLVIRMPPRLDMDALHGFFEEVDTTLGRKAPFAAVVDTSAITSFPDALERRYLVDGMNLRRFSEKAYNLGNAIVIVSATARAVLTAFNWARPPMTAQMVAATFPVAVEWCCQRLTGAHIALTPAIERLRETNG